MDTNKCINLPCDRYFSSPPPTRDSQGTFTGKDRGKNWIGGKFEFRSRDRVARRAGEIRNQSITWPRRAGNDLWKYGSYRRDKNRSLVHCPAVRALVINQARDTRANPLISLSLTWQLLNRTYITKALCPTSLRTKSVSEMNERTTRRF